MHTLAAEAITKSYAKRPVVRGVSLSVHSGETVGLLGPNGAGKTTSFYMCVGLVAPTSGRVLLDGEDVSQQPVYERARKGIGYLPQEPSVFRKLTVEQNIMAILETIPTLATDNSRKERHEELLEMLGVAELRTSLASALSGGERRRVEIARALALNPFFLLLDEPFAGIDPIAVGDLQIIIDGLRNQGIGTLITDHNVRETLGICDRAYILVDGKVMVEGSPKEIASNPDAQKYYLGEGFVLN